MALVFPFEAWTGLDNVPGRNRSPAAVSQVMHWMQALNSIAGHHRRTLFCQHFLDDSASSLIPILRFRYNEDRQNARRLIFTGLALPPFTANPPDLTATPRVESSTGNYSGLFEVEATISEPEDIRALAWGENITPTGVYTARSVSTFNSYRLVGLACHESRSTPMLDTTWGESVAGSGFATQPIRHQLWTDLRALEDALWLRHRPVLAAWSARGFADAQARSVSTTTFTNLISLATTARSATTPGEVCPAQFAGRGTETTVAARVACRATVTGGSATVRFTSSQNSVDATVTAGAAWFQPSASLLLDTTVEYDKVDIFGSAPAGETLRVWAWMIQVDPT